MYINDNFGNLLVKDSDDDFICASNYILDKANGINNIHIINDISIEKCKNKCLDNKSCIAFNYSNNVCELKKGVDVLFDSNSSDIVCVKKYELDHNLNKKVRKEQESREQVSREQVETEIKKNNINNKILSEENNMNTINYTLSETGLSETGLSETSLAKLYNTSENIDSKSKDTITNAQIYVDLNCFLNNIDVLKNKTSDLMIDLDLLLTNLKTCSYVKKDLDNKTTIRPIEPDTVKLISIPTNVIVTTPSNTVDIVKEPFKNTSFVKNRIWGIQDLLVIVVLCFVIYLLFLKK